MTVVTTSLGAGTNVVAATEVAVPIALVVVDPGADSAGTDPAAVVVSPIAVVEVVAGTESAGEDVVVVSTTVVELGGITTDEEAATVEPTSVAVTGQIVVLKATVTVVRAVE